MTAVCVNELGAGTLQNPDLICVSRSLMDGDFGDSGGPVFYRDTTTNNQYLMGITGGIHNANELWFSMMSGISNDFGGLGSVVP